jgi:hypothetical protein
MPGAEGHPILHYLRVRAKHGCNPNSHFDTNWYLGQYPEVAAARIIPKVKEAGANPLSHYSPVTTRGLRLGLAVWRPLVSSGQSSKSISSPRRASLPAPPVREYAVCEWLASCVRQSRIGEGKRVETIPYGVDENVFRPVEKSEACAALSLKRTSCRQVAAGGTPRPRGDKKPQWQWYKRFRPRKI